MTPVQPASGRPSVFRTASQGRSAFFVHLVFAVTGAGFGLIGWFLENHSKDQCAFYAMAWGVLGAGMLWTLWLLVRAFSEHSRRWSRITCVLLCVEALGLGYCAEKYNWDLPEGPELIQVVPGEPISHKDETPINAFLSVTMEETKKASDLEACGDTKVH